MDPVDPLVVFMDKYKFRPSEPPSYIASQKTGQCYFDTLFNILFFGDFWRQFSLPAFRLFKEMPRDLLSASEKYKDACLAKYEKYDSSLREKLALFARRYILIKLAEKGATREEIEELGIDTPLDVGFNTGARSMLKNLFPNTGDDEYYANLMGSAYLKKPKESLSKTEREFIKQFYLQKDTNTLKKYPVYKKMLESNLTSAPRYVKSRRKSINITAGPILMSSFLCEDTLQSGQEIIKTYLSPVYGELFYTTPNYNGLEDFKAASIIVTKAESSHALAIVKRDTKYYILDNNNGIALEVKKVDISRFNGSNFEVHYGQYISVDGLKNCSLYICRDADTKMPYIIAKLDTDGSIDFDTSTYTDNEIFGIITDPSQEFLTYYIYENAPVNNNIAAARPPSGGRRKTKKRLNSKRRK
jgi:hypothetical protein